MKPETELRVKRHGEQLKAFFNLPMSVNPVSLCRKLRRLENKASKIMVDRCNGVDDTVEGERQHLKGLMSIEKQLDKLLSFKDKGIPVFMNHDPREYIIKIDDNYTKLRRDITPIHMDFGGYGIIAPDLTEE